MFRNFSVGRRITIVQNYKWVADIIKQYFHYNLNSIAIFKYLNEYIGKCKYLPTRL